MVSGLVATAECVDWLRARRSPASEVADSAGRQWEAIYPPVMGIPDMPRWRIAEKPEDPATTA